MSTFWSQQEDQKLISLRVDECMTLTRAAAALGRSEDSVSCRWSRLGREHGFERMRGTRIPDTASHFWSRVDKSGGEDACWPWSAKTMPVDGYGVVSFNTGGRRRNQGAHRVAFFLPMGER